MRGHHDGMDNEPRTDGGAVERRGERAAPARRAPHEQPAIERHTLPGTIPAVAYHEYHHDDRWSPTETPVADGKRLTDDEWLTYDVAIREPGPYDLTVRAATAADAETVIRLVVDDEPLRRLTLSSAGWDSRTDTDTWVELPAGLHTVHVVVLHGDVQLDRFEFR
jgi:hypothetical protein